MWALEKSDIFLARSRFFSRLSGIPFAGNGEVLSQLGGCRTQPSRSSGYGFKQLSRPEIVSLLADLGIPKLLKLLRLKSTLAAKKSDFSPCNTLNG